MEGGKDVEKKGDACLFYGIINSIYVFIPQFDLFLLSRRSCGTMAVQGRIKQEWGRFWGLVTT